MVTNNKTPGNFKHALPAGTGLLVWHWELTGIDGKQLSNHNQIVKMRNFRGATADDLKHHFVTLLEKKLERIVMHVDTNDAISKTSRLILDE